MRWHAYKQYVQAGTRCIRAEKESKLACFTHHISLNWIIYPHALMSACFQRLDNNRSLATETSHLQNAECPALGGRSHRDPLWSQATGLQYVTHVPISTMKIYVCCFTQHLELRSVWIGCNLGLSRTLSERTTHCERHCREDECLACHLKIDFCVTWPRCTRW
jgi:hypothetical protein